MKRKHISVVSDARYVSGNRIHQVSGTVVIAGIPNTSLMVVGCSGIRLPLGDCARDAVISGSGHLVYAAKVGRYTKSGMSGRIHKISEQNLLLRHPI